MLLPHNQAHHSSQDDYLAAQDDDDDGQDDHAVQNHAQKRHHDGAAEFPLPDIDLHGQAAEYGGVPDAVRSLLPIRVRGGAGAL